MGTFGSFSTVRLGIYVAQKGLDVTGNNITNINTTGYTRQRLNQVSLIPSASDRYYSSYKNRIGQGAVITGVEQLRDPGLDITFRKAQTDLSSADAKLAGLNDLAVILDEVGKGSLEQDDGVILSQLNDLRDLISQAITNGVDGYDSLIRESASALTTLFNSYADKLADLKQTYETELNQQVTEVNDILKGIQELNVSIRNADIRGDAALELRDQRNLLLDELSKYMKIDVQYYMEDVGADTKVERLKITLGNNAPHNHTLVDGEYGTKLEVASDGTYRIQLGALKDMNGKTQNGQADTSLTLLDNDLYGSIQSIRELLTEKGEFATTEESLAVLKKAHEENLNAQVEKVNELLKTIEGYNKVIYDTVGTHTQEEIDSATAKREECLELLNQYVSVKSTDDGKSLKIELDSVSPSIMLLDSTQAAGVAQFAAAGEGDDYKITITGIDGTTQTELDDDDLTGSIQTLRNQLNGEGAYYTTPDAALDSNAAIKRGIPYYQMALDNLAYEFAKQMNDLNNTGLEGSGNLFSMGSGTDDAAVYIDPSNPEAGELQRITAANISISKSWANQTVSIQAKADADSPSGDVSNLNQFLNVFEQKLSFDPSDINAGAAGDPYSGTIEDMLLKIQSTLAEDQMSTDAIVNNYAVTADEIYVDREGVMGVDLNDEATSLMTYQKAYTAACRLMTTLEEALDSLLAM